MDQFESSSGWEELEQLVLQESSVLEKLFLLLRQTIIGQEILLERLVVGLLCNGHILLEGLPGLAKTLAVKSLAQAINAKFSRIQFTSDILPADILGTMIYDIHTNEFTVKKGPVFSNFVLADEINRAPEKAQSALLEAMQEHQVTIGNTTYMLNPPFMVLATQNPIEQSGTYELPEAQMDRFMLKVMITYPQREEERLIIQKIVKEESAVMPAVTSDQIIKIQSLVKKIYLDVKIEDYILDIIGCTRTPQKFNLSHLQSYIKFGSSPRGSINLAIAARAYAFLQKRAFVIPADVFAIAPDVLRHRIGLSYTAMAENVTTDDLLQQILSALPTP